jgi:hypothetical protein
MLRTIVRPVTLGGAALILILLALFAEASTHLFAQAPTASSATISVFATGLNNPRGLKFGPDGNLYVAEGGLGGTRSTVGQCQQVPAPVGPYTGGFTARISKINATGVRKTVIDHLPSDQTSPALGSEVSGVADVAFIGNQLYAVLSGAGCSHGFPGKPNAVLRIDVRDHQADYIANLSHFLKTHPVKNPNPADFEPDGTWYGMIAVGKSLYAVEPNHGELDKITPKGDQDGLDDSTISRVVDISASKGHIVPTAITFHNGNFYVGNLDTFPIMNDSTTGNPFPTPGTGKVLRVTASGTLETIASHLTLPTAMTFGPDGDDLYVSTFGFGFGPGAGQVVRIDI